jgi:uncharacterized protein (TIGR03437 family)
MRKQLLTGAFSLLAIAPALPLLAQAPPQFNSRNLAGNGTAGFSGNGSAATDAQLNNPFSVAFDASANVYIADQLNNRVRKIGLDGVISTAAGDGTASSGGDGKEATSAQLVAPCGIAVDRNGNVLVTDADASLIRRFTPGGNITTFAGTSSTAGTFSGDGGKAPGASLNHPRGLAVDSSGNVYIADSGNSRIRIVSTDGIIRTYAGGGSARGDGGAATDASLSGPQGIALDSAGNLYIADTNSHRVRKVARDGTITTIAGSGTRGYSGDGGLAVRAMLNSPAGVAVDSVGNVFVADTSNSRIRVVTPGGAIWTVAGTSAFADGGEGPAISAALRFPSGVAVDRSDRVLVVDTQNSRIRLLTPLDNLSAAPVIRTDGVRQAADFGGSATVAPGGWVEMYGDNLASKAREWTNDDFNDKIAPTSLDGTRVTIGGKQAYLSYVSPKQINAQVPNGVTSGTRQLVVTTPSGSSAQYAVVMTDLQPGLCAPAAFQVGGRQYLAALASDGRTFLFPENSVPGVASRPAHPGETMTLYGVGFGSVTSFLQDGERADQPARLSSSFALLFDNVPATVLYAGTAPGSLGLYQFNVVVPAMPDNDVVPVKATVGSISTTQSVFISVKN